MAQIKGVLDIYCFGGDWNNLVGVMNNCAKRKNFFWGVLGIFSEELGIFSKQYLPQNPRKRPVVGGGVGSSIVVGL